VIATMVAGACVLGMSLPTQALDPAGNGNRRNQPREYKAEVSVAKVFANTVAATGKWGKPSEPPVIIDVRSVPEYAYGHIEKAHNVPYPFIMQYCDSGDGIYTGTNPGRNAEGGCKDSAATRLAQQKADFQQAVLALVPDKKRPVYTLCATGTRSIGAANALKEAGYENVYNIWEGFSGLYWNDNSGPDSSPGNWPLDFNNDGVITDLDKDGWKYQGLPVDMRLLPPYLYEPYAYLYYKYQQ
jgi:rhodanese-related sulfurtransferase